MKTFTVFDLLTPKEATFYLNSRATLKEAVEKFGAHKFSVVPIIDDNGNYITTISEGDILRYIANNKENFVDQTEKVNVLEICKYRPYNSLNVEAVFDEIYGLCLSQNFIPIVDDRDKLIGIIKRKDVFVYLKNNK